MPIAEGTRSMACTSRRTDRDLSKNSPFFRDQSSFFRDQSSFFTADGAQKNLPRALRPPFSVPQPLVQLLVHVVRNVRILVDLKPRQPKQVQVDSTGGVSIRILPRGPNEEAAVREHADVDL